MTPRTGRVGLDVEDPGRSPASRREAPAPNASAPARGFLSRLESS
ncbi:hypothetical protein ACFYW9_04835 [Streptomyces sp. NPDC002698]